MGFDTLVKRIRELASVQPDKLAVAFKKEQLTYAELNKKICGICAVLKELGVEKGDRVCFSAVSKPEMVAIYLGVQCLGAVAVFVDKNGTPENIASIYDEAESKILLSDKPMGEYAQTRKVVSLREVYAQADMYVSAESEYHLPDEDDLAEILFTTGTTGKPKGVMLTYKSVYHILANTIQGIGILETDRVLLPLPLNHSFALRVLRAVLYKGATVVLQNGFTFAKEVENNIGLYRCNAMAAVPASYEVMRGQMQDEFVRVLENMRYIEFGAGSLTARQRMEITSLLPQTTIYNTWGSSETGGAIFCNVTEVVKKSEKITSLGKVLPHTAVGMLDSDGNFMESSVSNPGRMALKGDMKMAGYWNNSDLTEETIRGEWILTSDMAYVDEDGYVFMLGRADDIINVGGEKVSPLEVENILGQYEAIKECACIGVDDPDGVLGQIPVLFVVTKAGYTEEQLQKFLTTKMERYKFPRRYIVVESIPRNRMQKIDRKELKQMWENKDTLDLMNPVMQSIFSRRSIRKFTDQEIPRPILDMILKAGYHAPSGHNMQSWRFTVLTKQEDILRLKESAREAAAANKVHFYGFENPKVVVIVSNDNRNPNGCQDASCAAENMFLAAHSYGIGSVWLNPLMTLRNVMPVKEVLDEFDIPANHTVWAMVAMGYPVADGVALAKKTDVVKYI